MKRLLGCALLFLAASELTGQGPAAAAANPARPARQPRAEKDPVKAAVGGNSLAKGEAITTEIYADEAFFDSGSHIGIFTGHVIVNDPRFNVQADKLTVYLSKTEKPAPPAEKGEGESAPKENQGLEKAIAEGNVGVVRDHADDKGGPPVHTVGRADMATYTTDDGKVELRGTPRVQSGMNTHVATSPDTIMVIDQAGQLVTKGPSRTEIRQEPKTPAASPAAAPPKP